MMSSRITLLPLFLLTTFATTLHAQDDETVDFSDQMTATCELIGLVASPPADWFNVPTESEARFRGCQMMRTNEQEELVGLMRLLSLQLPPELSDDEWSKRLIDFETEWLAGMGIQLGETMWKRDDVPIAGQGFEGARAIGYASRIEGNEVPQEVHFLVFAGASSKYLISLSTPARTVEGGVHYQRNTSDFGVLISTLKLPDSE